MGPTGWVTQNEEQQQRERDSQPPAGDTLRGFRESTVGMIPDCGTIQRGMGSDQETSGESRRALHSTSLTQDCDEPNPRRFQGIPGMATPSLNRPRSAHPWRTASIGAQPEANDHHRGRHVERLHHPRRGGRNFRGADRGHFDAAVRKDTQGTRGIVAMIRIVPIRMRVRVPMVMGMVMAIAMKPCMQRL